MFAFLAACGNSNETVTERQNDKNTSKNAAQTEGTWYHDWNTGMEAAKKEQKPVLVDFSADWCKWCHVMEEKTFSAPEIKKRLDSGWISIRIDTEERDKTGTVYFDESSRAALMYLKDENSNFEEKPLSHQQLLGFFGIRGLPSYLFIDREGKPLQKITSYIEKEEFAVILDFIKEEAYKKNISFEDYRKSKTGGGS